MGLVKPMTGKYIIIFFQYQGDVGCVCLLNGWISCNDVFCADNYNYFWFKLKGKCRSEKGRGVSERVTRLSRWSVIATPSRTGMCHRFSSSPDGGHPSCGETWGLSARCTCDEGGRSSSHR